MRSVKHLSFTLLMALIPAIAFAQNCKFDEDKKDPFTNGRLRVVAHKIGPVSWNWNFSLEENGGKYFISMRMLRAGKMEDMYPKDRKVMIKLENGKILELTADKDFPPGYAVSSDGVIWTNYIPKFEVDKAFLTDLSSSPITDIKVTLGSQDIMLPKITGKQTDRIKESAACLVKG